MTIMFGDIHLYEEHLPMARQQLSRNILKFPTLHITKPPPEFDVDKMIDFLESITPDDIQLRDYNSWGLIKAPMKA